MVHLWGRAGLGLGLSHNLTCEVSLDTVLAEPLALARGSET